MLTQLLMFPARPEDSEIEVANMKEGVGKMEAFPSVSPFSYA